MQAQHIRGRDGNAHWIRRTYAWPGLPRPGSPATWQAVIGKRFELLGQVGDPGVKRELARMDAATLRLAQIASPIEEAS